MTRLFYSASLLLTGVVLGWWLHGQLPPAAPVSASGYTRESISPVGSAALEVATGRPRELHRPQPGDTKADPADSVPRLRQLLNQQDYARALALYEHSLILDHAAEALLKPVIEDYLKACLQHCAEGAFVALADAWLANYYEDIPVLLLVAEYQRMQGFPEEAAQVLHMAMTYAYQPNQRERVTQALRRLVKNTDNYLSQQQQWIELLGFYELLETIALSEPVFRLRQAMIYRLLGEPERTRSILLALRASDSELDPQWTEAIELQLADIAPEPEPIAVNALPVTRRGDHYLVETTLNDRQKVVLMIDTGASITSLSRTSFDRLAVLDFDQMSSRLFNTANGLTRGEVYRASSIALGDTRIAGVDIAVLDYEPGDGVDGLLGMNFLRNYRFEIDQERELLYLRPR